MNMYLLWKQPRLCNEYIFIALSTRLKEVELDLPIPAELFNFCQSKIANGDASKIKKVIVRKRTVGTFKVCKTKTRHFKRTELHNGGTLLQLEVTQDKLKPTILTPTINQFYALSDERKEMRTSNKNDVMQDTTLMKVHPLTCAIGRRVIATASLPAQTHSDRLERVNCTGVFSTTYDNRIWNKKAYNVACASNTARQIKKWKCNTHIGCGRATVTELILTSSALSSITGAR